MYQGANTSEGSESLRESITTDFAQQGNGWDGLTDYTEWPRVTWEDWWIRWRRRMDPTMKNLTFACASLRADSFNYCLDCFQKSTLRNANGRLTASFPT